MTEYFFFGFAVAMAIVAAITIFTYSYLKHAGRKSTNIKGYLDLIPDLSDEQRLRVQDIRQTFLPKVEGIRQNLC